MFSHLVYRNTIKALKVPGNYHKAKPCLPALVKICNLLGDYNYGNTNIIIY